MSGGRRRSERGAGAAGPPAAPPAGSRAARRAAQEAKRDAEKADARARLRRRGLIGAAVLVVLVGIGLVVAVLAGGDGADESGDAGSDRSQRTLLVQVHDAAGEPAFANAILAVDPAVVLSVPAGLVTDVPGRGSSTLAETVETGGGGANAQAALTDQLELVVDGSWLLDAESLAALVDGAGGVTVDVDVDVTGRDEDGARMVVVPAGDAKQLTGADAAAFAAHLKAGEPEQARLARFTSVLRELLIGLPDSSDEVADRLAALPGSTSTQDADQLAGLLVELARAMADDEATYPSLPVLDDQVGTEEPTLRLDREAAEQVVDTHFADSRPATPAGGRVSVLVQNGVGTGGLLEAARSRLRAAGLMFEHGGNANRLDYERTVVIVPDDSAQSRERGRQVSRALGVGPEAVATGSQGAGVADVVVVLGADFQP